MASSGSVFSETLQSITDEKLAELSKRRAAFESRKASISDAVQTASDLPTKVRILLDGVKECFAVKTAATGRIVPGSTGNHSLEVDLTNVQQFLSQTQYDPSISTKSLEDWQSSLAQHLEAQSAKYKYASLYAQLVIEWLSVEKESGTTSASGGDTTEGFEQVASKERLESRVEWEQEVFEPLHTDRRAIESYLDELFGRQGTKQPAAKALDQVRESLEDLENRLAAPEQFTQQVLQWTIKSLIASDLLTDEKRAMLRDFCGNPTILTEIGDVLNLRMAAFDTWSWGDEVPVEQRKKLNGTYQIYMHEDVLQAIFLHYIGIKWSVSLKSAFRSFGRFEGAWNSPNAEIPKEDEKRRGYFLGRRLRKGSVQSKRRRIYESQYFVTQLLDYENQEIEIPEGDEEAELDDEPKSRTKQTARKSMMAQPDRRVRSLAGPNVRSGPLRHRRILPDEDEVDYSDEEECGFGAVDDDAEVNSKPKNPMASKQALLHLLATEILINTRLYGEQTCIHAEFDRWNSSLPHSTVATVLAFLGVPPKWLNFFRKFMEAPLAFPGEQSRLRKKGVPASHSLSEVLGEAVLFCLDFSINQATKGQPLYRMQQDLWFWSPDHKICVTAWKSIRQFAEIMGAKINQDKAGTVRTSGGRSTPVKPIDASLPAGPIRWGFLYLDAKSGRFSIDQKMVDRHIHGLQTQLSDKRSIFSWIQAWNTYATTFFSTNFGKPAACYGQAHIDMILETLNRVQRQISEVEGQGHTSVVESLKARLTQRFDFTDIPDGFIFFPTAFGGLELTSPFIPLLQIRDAVPANPEHLLDEFEEAEREGYRGAQTRFENDRINRDRLKYPNWRPDHDADHFMSFDEFTRYREEYAAGYAKDLGWVFDKLMKAPDEHWDDGLRKTGELIRRDPRTAFALDELRVTDEEGSGIHGRWDQMSGYWRWMVQLYGREMMERFGGLRLVDRGLLPIGMVNLMAKGGRVMWKD